MALRARDAAPPLPDELSTSYAATFGRLQRMFRGRGLDAEEAADLAQETVARTLLHLDRHGLTQDDLGPLMGRIARNLVVERARSRRPKLVALSGAEAVDDPSQDPHEQLARRERQQAVRQALDGLNHRHREALLLSLSGITPSEIAHSLGVERNAADAILHRARRRLAERLADSRERLAGWAGVLWLRTRVVAKRASDTASLHPVSVSASQTIGTLIMAAVMGAASLSGGGAAGVAPSPAPATVTRTEPAPSSRSPETVGRTETKGSEEGEDGTQPVSTTADVREHRVGAGAAAPNPVTGEEAQEDVEIWHEPEDDRGVTGPLLDQGTEGLCGALAPRCDGGGE